MGPDMNEKVKIAAFNGTGFHNWKFRVETVLDTYDLLDCLTREAAAIAEWREEAGDSAEVRAEKNKKLLERKVQEKKCKALIIQAIADNQLELVKDCDTPKKIWDTLKTVFERRGIAGQIYIRKQLLTLKYEEGAGGGLSEHMLEFDRLIRELKDSGAAVEDSDAICHLLLTLPPSFDSVVTAIETLPGGVTMDFVKKRLLDVDLKKRNLGVSDGNSEGVAMASKHSRKKIKCFRCGKIGHKAADCRVQVNSSTSEDEQKPTQKPKDKNEKKTNNHKANAGVEEDQPEVAFMASKEEEEFVSMCWYLDSGATDHMLKDSSYFNAMRRLERPVEVVVANGQKLRAEYCGDVILYAEIDGKKKKCEAKNVLYLPGLSCNLFSVKRVTRSGLQVSFAGDRAEITKDGVVMAIGKFKDKLYVLDVSCKRSEMGVAMLAGKVSKDATVWHQRFGHAGCDSLRELVAHDMAKGLKLAFDDDTVMCAPCPLGKSIELPGPSPEEQCSQRPLELIHSDISGPYTPYTWNSKRFFVTFVDDYSKFAMVFLLSSKDEVVSCFRDYEALVSARFGSKITKLQTGNGYDHTDDKMRSFCRSKDIEIELTSSGVSEGVNCILIARARAMLDDSGFGRDMWGEAVYAATYITNRCPTSAVEERKTPYELWTGRQPNVSRMRIFGSAAYTYIPRDHRSKLDPKCKKLFMIGYTTNGYRLWDIEKQKVVTGRDIVFNEDLLFGSLNSKETAPPKTTTMPETMVELDLPLGDKYVATRGTQNDQEQNTSSDDELNAQQGVDPEPRRSGRVRREPVWFDCYEMSCGLALCADSFVEDSLKITGDFSTADWLAPKDVVADYKPVVTLHATGLASQKSGDLMSLYRRYDEVRADRMDKVQSTDTTSGLSASETSMAWSGDYQAFVHLAEDDRTTNQLGQRQQFVRDEIRLDAAFQPKIKRLA